MKKLLLFPLMALSSLVAAQNPGNPQGLESAITGLCYMSRRLLGIAIMLFLIISVIPVLLGAMLFIFKKEDKKLKSIGKILLMIGGLCIILAIIGIVIYIILPTIMNSLVSSSNVSGYDCSQPPPTIPPSCGNSTCQSSRPYGSNCTCLEY